MNLLKPNKLSSLALICLVCAGCSKPTPLSDAQLKTLVDSCKEFGMATRYFDNGIKIDVECIPIINKST